MSRPEGSANKRHLEFLKRFEALAAQYVDPMELLFQVAAKSPKAGKGWDTGHRLSSAQTLMGFRYPKLRALEITEANETPKIQISWLDANDIPLKPSENQLDLLDPDAISH